jgi:TetR/AcrR family transcriptional regulator
VVSGRRIGAEDSATRTRLIEAAERLMAEEGYAAVTTRRLATSAGLKPQLVHYYFRTLDDLFLEIHRRVVRESIETIRAAMRTDNPVRALWAYYSDPPAAALKIELRALANHRKALADYVQRSLVTIRKVQVSCLHRHLKSRGIASRAEAVKVDVAVVSLSRFLVSEQILGATVGHTETSAFVEDWLAQFDGSGPLDRPLWPGAPA